MSKEIRRTLAQLPEVFDERTVGLELPQFKSDDPLINGKSMTTNSDKIYRLDRHISEVAKWKRTAQTKQLINYCQWRVGLRETCDKPSTQILCILSNYKNNKLELIPENFKILIDCHKQLVEDALAIDLRKVRKSIKGEWQTIKKDKETKVMTKRKRKTSPDRIKEYERQLRCWTGSTNDGTAVPTEATVRSLKYFQLYGTKGYPKGYSKPLLEAMKKHPEQVELLYADTLSMTIKLKSKEQKSMSIEDLYKSIMSVSKQKSTEEDVKMFEQYCNYRIGNIPVFNAFVRPYWGSVLTMTKQNKLRNISTIYRRFVNDNKELVLAAANTDQRKRKKTETATKQVKELPNHTSCTEPHQSSAPASSNTISDTLSMLIQLAKNSGATEITIKL